MRIEIIGKDYNISNRLREIIENKVQKLNRYFEDNADVKVVCKQQKELYKMEVSISSKGMFWRAEVSNNENMYVNIDLALPKIERQIVKNKEKIKTQLRSTAFDEDVFEFVQERELAPSNTVVKQKRFELGAPITTEDAQMMLEMSDHNFYIYHNVETGLINVIYRRNDGKFGNIEIVE